MVPSHSDAPTPPRSSASPLFLAGPTAVGKSEIALLLAERLGGEIVSVDSMQVYRGLDIGTAKPSPEERVRIAHHLLDVAELTESFDAARFVQLAQAAVADIHARGRLPLLCGGTGLYFKAFLEGLSEAPSADPALRAELRATPLPDLLSELAERDPAAFERIDRNNPRRVIRALEVIRLTGRAFSAQRVAWHAPSPALQRTTRDTQCVPLVFGLARSPEDLRSRINARVDAMFHRGLVAETEGLLKRGLAWNEIALQAIGYRQVVEHLQGKPTLPETIELVKKRTRQFAKRQMTWFRRQLPVRWIELGEGRSAEAVADRLAQEFHNRRIAE